MIQIVERFLKWFMGINNEPVVNHRNKYKKLNYEEINDIMNILRHRKDIPIKEVAYMFDCSESTVYRIRRGEKL